MSLKSMSFTPPSIKIPTKIKAGAVACAGIIEIIGTNIIDSKNKSAVVRLVSPVLPPSAIPADDSTTVVTVLVPTKAPAAVEIASLIRAFFKLITSPFSSTRPDCFAAASKVPSESNIFTSEKLRTSIVTVKIDVHIFSPAKSPAKSKLKNETSKKSLTCAPKFKLKFEIWVSPIGIPKRVEAKIEIKIAPLTFL